MCFSSKQDCSSLTSKLPPIGTDGWRENRVVLSIEIPGPESKWATQKSVQWASFWSQARWEVWDLQCWLWGTGQREASSLPQAAGALLQHCLSFTASDRRLGGSVMACTDQKCFCKASFLVYLFKSTKVPPLHAVKLRVSLCLFLRYRAKGVFCSGLTKVPFSGKGMGPLRPFLLGVAFKPRQNGKDVHGRTLAKMFSLPVSTRLGQTFCVLW